MALVARHGRTGCVAAQSSWPARWAAGSTMLVSERSAPLAVPDAEQHEAAPPETARQQMASPTPLVVAAPCFRGKELQCPCVCPHGGVHSGLAGLSAPLPPNFLRSSFATFGRVGRPTRRDTGTRWFVVPREDALS